MYASGINPENPEDVVARKAAEGYRAFKLKVGFDDARDVRNALHVRELLGAATPLMADANQGWDLPRARQMAQRLGPAQLDWLE
ncbi:enolase C-terminal domain-like protein, partial [Bordetella bronchiseptica]